MSQNIEQFMQGLRKRNPGEERFAQAVEEVATSVFPLLEERPELRDAQILERLTEPDRIVIFRVTWQTDSGEIRANRAWRVQFNHALGPYKGGLRFHPTVDQDTLKFLGFEQIFKNSLTGLPMGGAKGGSNFNPKGKSDDEVMRFCQSMMTELHRHIGEDIDVPAGDIGVGGREVSYLFGQYLRLENRWSGVLTGKGQGFGGSAVRKEATGYGCVYFCQHVLEEASRELEGLDVAISGSGNVALYAAQKAMELGARVVTLSDSDGVVYMADGLSNDAWEEIRELKEERRGRLSEWAEGRTDVEYDEGGRPWSRPCDVAMPCATQNELDEDDARTLIGNDVVAVCEGANMPTTAAATEAFREAGVLHAPGKAANAGGVAVSGLEMSQNAMRMSWSAERVDEELREIMRAIHERCVADGRDGEHIDYVHGANRAGFRKVAEAMLAYGAV